MLDPPSALTADVVVVGGARLVLLTVFGVLVKEALEVLVLGGKKLVLVDDAASAAARSCSTSNVACCCCCC